MTDKELKRLEFAKTSCYKKPTIDIHKSAIIHRSAVIGTSGFGYQRDLDGTLVKIYHRGSIKINQGVEVRALVTIDAATVDGVFTEIGEGSAIDHHCHISHNVYIGKHTTIAAHTSVEGSCVVGDYCTVGSNVTIQRKVKVGNWVTIGSGCVVTKDVPDYAVIVGNPHRILRFTD